MDKRTRGNVYVSALVLIALCIAGILVYTFITTVDNEGVFYPKDISTNKDKPDTCLVYKEHKTVFVRKLK